MDTIKGVVGDGQKQSSPPVDLSVGQVWTRGSQKRTITGLDMSCVQWKFPDVTNGGDRNTYSSRVSFRSWIRADPRRGRPRATLETNTGIPDNEFTPPHSGPQEGEWDCQCDDGLSDDEYEGRHDPIESRGWLVSGGVETSTTPFPPREVIEDDGHQD